MAASLQESMTFSPPPLLSWQSLSYRNTIRLESSVKSLAGERALVRTRIWNYDTRRDPSCLKTKKYTEGNILLPTVYTYEICRSKSYVKATILVNKAKLERREGLFRDRTSYRCRRVFAADDWIAADCEIRLIVAAMQHCRPRIMTETREKSYTAYDFSTHTQRPARRRTSKRKEGRNEAERCDLLAFDDASMKYTAA